MKHERYSSILVILAFLLASFMLCWHLGQMPLQNPDEGRNASTAFEMQQTGNWLLPTYNGIPSLEKPAFFFKAVSLSLSAFGHSALAARIPSVLFAFGILILVWYFCRREYDQYTSAIAIAIISTIPMFFVLGRYVIFDMTLAFFMCTAIFAGYFAESDEITRKRQRQLWLLAASQMGLATLVKGPVGFIVPCLVLIIFNRLEHKRGALKRLIAWPNILIFCIIVLPWFIGTAILQPDFPYYGLVRESLLRFTTTVFHHAHPFYYYLPVTLVAMLYWSLLLPGTLWACYKQRTHLTRADRLCVTWGTVVILFFSVSSAKLPHYILTTAIAFGILIARTVIQAFKHQRRMAHTVRQSGWALMGVGALIAAICLFSVAYPQWLDQFILYKLTSADVAAIHAVLLPIGLIFLGAATVALVGILTRKSILIFFAFLSLMPACVLTTFTMLHYFAEQQSQQFLQTSPVFLQKHSQVACYACFPTGAPFYLQQKLTVFTQDHGNEISNNYVQFWLQRHTEWPAHMQPINQFTQWLKRQHEPVLILVRPDALAQVRQLTHTYVTQFYQFNNVRYVALLISPQGTK